MGCASVRVGPGSCCGALAWLGQRGRLAEGSGSVEVHPSSQVLGECREEESGSPRPVYPFKQTMADPRSQQHASLCRPQQVTVHNKARSAVFTE